MSTKDDKTPSKGRKPVLALGASSVLVPATPVKIPVPRSIVASKTPRFGPLSIDESTAPTLRATPALPAEAPRPHAGDEILPALDPAFPLVLLPVRIETRFRSGELLVRVYPDEIFADGHEPELTDIECKAAIRYWVDADAGHERDAWEALVQAFGAPRAAWIVSSTRVDRGVRRTMKPSSWTRAVQARLLPDRWIVHLAPVGGPPSVHCGAPIVGELALSLKPPAEEGPPTDERDAPLYLDDEVRWTVDFGAAERAGMALRIPIGGVTEFRRVLVFGVRSASDPRETAGRLADLFEAHRYTSGLAFVPQGTRTNNSESGAASYTAGNRDGARPSTPASPEPCERAHPTNDAVLAAALGLETSTFKGLEGAGLREQGNAWAMNTALWPATLGYFLAQRAEPFVSVETWDEARAHFEHWVRGRGPVPCFRVGRVPYGVLPVSSLARWVSPGRTAFDKQIVDLLQSAWPIWSAATRSVPRTGRTHDDPLAGRDPDVELLEILGMDASAREVRVRYGLGPQALLNAASLLGLPPSLVDFWCSTRLRGVHPEARALGLGGSLAATIYNPNAPRMTDPFVCAEPLSEERSLADDYITEIRGASLDNLRQGELATRSTPPLLFRLLRHSVLLEYVRLSRELQRSVGAAPDLAQRSAARLREPEVVMDGDLRVTTWGAIDEALNYNTLLSLSERERRGSPEALGYAKDQLGPLSDALELLAMRPTAELERLLTETLDTCSHRLDAWVTSLFTERLHAMREARPIGCYVGAYARVENLRARGARPVSDGYIHAPSLDHAATAAVLRSAFATHDDGEGRFAIDLSSARVRAAQSILDPVRAGRSLGEVLGCQVERVLDERGLRRYIDPLRERFPLVANKMVDSGLAPSEVAARSVVDGLALHRGFDALLASGMIGGVRIGSAASSVFLDLKRELATSLDAVSDLLTAESVFQIVRGNTAIAGATLDALAKGARPPDPEVARSPRSGVGLTHRVALALVPSARVTSVWGLPREVSMRSQIEPTLDDWVGRVLGDPTSVCCVVTWQSIPETGRAVVSEKLEVSLGDLQLQPLDVLALSHEAPSDWRLEAPPGSPAGTPLAAPVTEINRRIIGYVSNTRERAMVTEIVHTVSDRGTKRTFPQLWEVARTLDDVLRSARPMRAEDMSTEVRSTVRPQSIQGDVSDRLKTLVRRFAGCCSGLSAGGAVSLRASLVTAASFAVPGAYPAPAWLAEGTDESLAARSRDVLREMVRRLAKAAGVAPPAEVNERSIDALRASATAALSSRALDVAASLFGAAPLLLLPFSVVDPSGIVDAFGAESTSGAKPPEVRRWFHQASRVRPALARWRKLSLYLATIPPLPGDRTRARATAMSRMLPLRIAQFTPTPHDRWAALPFLPETLADGRTRLVVPPSGTISVAAHLPDGCPPGLWAGLVLDEWVELIPNQREVTGIAFHHDDPGAEAAQTVLVAVPPRADTPWDAETLASVLDETFELAKMRAVDAERLGSLGQLIPAIHIADNGEKATVSTDFRGSLLADPPPSTEGAAR